MPLDSDVDLDTQPRIVIELGGLEDLLDSTSDTFNDKIVEAILASDDLTKIFEMKADGTGQFDQVITEATAAIILEIKKPISPTIDLPGSKIIFEECFFKNFLIAILYLE